MTMGQTDPELLRQLDDAKTSGEPVTAVVKLRRTAGKPPEPAAVQEQTQRAVDRTIQTTGEHPDDVHVMSRLSVAYVSGSEKFLREFVEQPEVASAVANQTKQTSTGRGAAATDDAPQHDAAQHDAAQHDADSTDTVDTVDAVDDALGTPTPAAGPASGRSNGRTSHSPD
jgi:acyl carrier protein